jgi:hypothetical protein
LHTYHLTSGHTGPRNTRTQLAAHNTQGRTGRTDNTPRATRRSRGRPARRPPRDARTDRDGRHQDLCTANTNYTTVTTHGNGANAATGSHHFSGGGASAHKSTEGRATPPRPAQRDPVPAGGRQRQIGRKQHYYAFINKTKNPDSIPTVNRQHPDKIPTVNRQYPDKIPTVNRQYPDKIPTVNRQYPDSQPTIS